MSKKRIYYDLETTSLSTGLAEILQIAYIIYDEDSDMLTSYSQYYYPDNEVPASAAAVNGLSKGKLEFLSEGKIFEDDAHAICELFSEGHVICGFNSDAYDNAVLRNRLRDLGEELPANLTTHDVLKKIRRLYPSESHKQEVFFRKLINKRGIEQSDINSLFSRVFPQADIKFHDARYDAFCTLLIDLLT